MRKIVISLVAGTLGIIASPVMAELRLGLDSSPYPPFYEADSNGDFIGRSVWVRLRC